MFAKFSFESIEHSYRLAPAPTRGFPNNRPHPKIESLELRTMLSAGALDPFPSGNPQSPGVITDDAPRGNNVTAAIAVTDRGGSVVVSTFTPKNGNAPELMVELFQPTGLLEPKFGNHGRVILRIGALGTEARGVAIDSSGQILIAAAADTNPSGPSGANRRDDSTDEGQPIPKFHDWALVRLKDNGALDKTFGTNGIVQMDVGSIDQNNQPPLTMAQVGSFAQDQPSQIIALPNGQFLVNGFAPEVSFDQGSGKNLQIFENTRFVVRKFNANGSIDTTFGANGDAEHFAGNAMAIGPSGDIFVAGGRRVLFESSGVSDSSEITHFNSDGSLDTHFADNGTFSFISQQNSFSSGTPGIVVQPDDKLVVGLTHLIRFNINGTLDTTFSGDGFAPTGLGGAIYKILIDAAGNILAVGNKVETLPNTKLNSDLVISRVLPNGTLDTSFGTAGRTAIRFASSATAVDAHLSPDAALGPDGAIYTAATQNASAALVRFTDSQGPEALIDTREQVQLSTTHSLQLPIAYRSPAGVDFGTFSTGDIQLVRENDGLALTPRYSNVLSPVNAPAFDIMVYRVTLMTQDAGLYDVRIIHKQVFGFDGFPIQARSIGHLQINLPPA
ncbi:MAG TPA: hypothetical protein VHS31_00485 [Tepidisphaeraceae bacterium]|jgi:uncharacterized delta-60 repeat protein|nr:hypothetical protein [Tepidisphaeraceae bacterium]